MNGCDLGSFSHPAGEGDCDKIFKSLRNLKELVFNGAHDCYGDEPTHLGVNLQSCVKIIAKHLKQLEILEISCYPFLRNEDVVELIVNLTDLKKLNIWLCSGIDNQLFPLLTAHPKYVERRLTLNIIAGETGMEVPFLDANPVNIKVHFLDIWEYDRVYEIKTCKI